MKVKKRMNDGETLLESLSKIGQQHAEVSVTKYTICINLHKQSKLYTKIGAGNRRNSSPVEAVHRLRTVAVDHEGHGHGRMVEYIGELLLFLLRKAAQHPIRQIPPGVGFCANPELYPGERYLFRSNI